MTFRLAGVSLGILLLWSIGGFSAAQSPAPPPPGEAWIEVTRNDVEAAYALLHDNHPAALPQLGDTEFVSRLERNRKVALERSVAVRDQAGHTAVLNGFATGLGDGHLSYNTVSSLTFYGLDLSCRSATTAGAC